MKEKGEKRYDEMQEAQPKIKTAVCAAHGEKVFGAGCGETFFQKGCPHGQRANIFNNAAARAVENHPPSTYTTIPNLTP